MSNIEAAAKSDVTAARTGIRGWMANHPFAWGLIAFCTGVAASVAVQVLL